MAARPIRLSINALGGQGGGVLADWIIALGEGAGWTVQATSVPGVAQRTGATVYYLELAPPDPAGRVPVQALMPVPGDVDIVIASELMEAGRAIARGLVTPDRTVLIASSHRIFAIAEKSAMGDGITSPARVLDACRISAKRLVLADFQAVAEARGSVISAALFGALAGSGALPFPRTAFEAAVRGGGRGVAPSLAAFAAALDLVVAPPADPAPPAPRAVPPATSLSQLRRQLTQTLPAPVQATATLGIERLTDYQDASYARQYLDRLVKIAGAERQLRGDHGDWALTRETARHLALWMAYEDIVRVADLKTRSARLSRVAIEARAMPAQHLAITEFLHPRFEEVCDLLPAWLGRQLIGSARARAWTASLIDRDRKITTTGIGGFALLYGLARLRRFRRGSFRFAVEQGRIEAWLETAINAARRDPVLGVEVIRCQRLVKGYGDTYARGWRSFGLIMRALGDIADRADAAAIISDLRNAALNDDEGRALARALSAIDGTDRSAAPPRDARPLAAPAFPV